MHSQPNSPLSCPGKELSYPRSTPRISDHWGYPQPARSGSSPEHWHHEYPPVSSAAGGEGMAQQQPDDHQTSTHNTGNNVNTPIAAPNSTYPYSQQPPYDPTPEMAHGYSRLNGGLHPQPLPGWESYGGHGGHQLAPGQLFYTPSAQSPSCQLYPSAHIRNKRPRRKYEEIDRMYTCVWNDCDRAYGTLQHLNNHVKAQSHGPKRTPEEFKKIRKELKARKKEEDNQRKAEEERQRHVEQAAARDGQDPQGPGGIPTSADSHPWTMKLPSIENQPVHYSPPSGIVPQQPLPKYPAPCPQQRALELLLEYCENDDQLPSH